MTVTRTVLLIRLAVFSLPAIILFAAYCVDQYVGAAQPSSAPSDPGNGITSGPVAIPAQSGSNFNIGPGFISSGISICTNTTTGSSCIGSVEFEYVEAVRSQIPIEAQDAPAPREAFRKWVMTLDDGKAKTTYLAILQAYDEQERRAEESRKAGEARMKELLADIPRAKCRRLIDKTPEGGIKAGDYKCEAAKASEFEAKAMP